MVQWFAWQGMWMLGMDNCHSEVAEVLSSVVQRFDTLLIPFFTDQRLGEGLSDPAEDLATYRFIVFIRLADIVPDLHLVFELQNDSYLSIQN